MTNEALMERNSSTIILHDMTKYFREKPSKILLKKVYRMLPNLMKLQIHESFYVVGAKPSF